MALSEQQLSAWSNQGATTSSATTYASIRAALEAHNWPDGMVCDVYLQGSYPNATNIRGNSDVDIVVEMTSSFYNDLTEEEKRARSLSTARYNFSDLRREVISALVSYYGPSALDTSGPNAIAVAANDSRLKADVLPCVTYREYNHGYTPVEGIQFWNQQTNQPKINFPKLHISSGQTKNQNGTGQHYKPSVRMLKNARESIIGSDENLRKKYPSYFVECLIFNVPDDQFSASRQDTLVGVINFLHATLRDARGPKFRTQSKQRYLFGSDSTQWSIENATAFVDQLVTLWKNR